MSSEGEWAFVLPAYDVTDVTDVDDFDAPDWDDGDSEAEAWDDVINDAADREARRTV